MRWSRGVLAARSAHGSRNNEIFGDAASYVERILKGAKVADFPVEQSTKIQLIIKLGTAKALDVTIPQSLLQRADELIE